MLIFVNQTPYELDETASLADALTRAGARAPFAAALNLQFVPKTHYATTALQVGDQIEVIAPITGG